METVGIGCRRKPRPRHLAVDCHPENLAKTSVESLRQLIGGRMDIRTPAVFRSVRGTLFVFAIGVAPDLRMPALFRSFRGTVFAFGTGVAIRPVVRIHEACHEMRPRDSRAGIHLAARLGVKMRVGIAQRRESPVDLDDQLNPGRLPCDPSVSFRREWRGCGFRCERLQIVVNRGDFAIHPQKSADIRAARLATVVGKGRAAISVCSAAEFAIILIGVSGGRRSGVRGRYCGRGGGRSDVPGRYCGRGGGLGFLSIEAACRPFGAVGLRSESTAQCAPVFKVSELTAVDRVMHGITAKMVPNPLFATYRTIMRAAWVAAFETTVSTLTVPFSDSGGNCAKRGNDETKKCS